MPKPKVELRCPANAHTGPHERTIEFSYVSGGKLYGGLINFFGKEDGLIVEVYRTDPGVEVRP
jgi:hypothetical protein